MQSGIGATVGDVLFRHGIRRTAAGNTYIDIYSDVGDYGARILKSSGSNGQFTLINRGTGSFAFQTNSAEVARFMNSGFFGINTASPAHRLDVSGDINTSANLRTGGAIRIDASGNLSNIGTIPVTLGGTGATSITGNKVMVANAAGNAVSTPTALHWDTTNTRLGVNETTPLSTLHVNGGTLSSTQDTSTEIGRFVYDSGNANQLRVLGYRHTTGTAWQQASTRIIQRVDASDMAYIEFNPTGGAGGLALGGSGGTNEYIRMTGSGRVGIGSKSPAFVLDVVGDTRVSSNLRVSDGTTTLRSLTTGAVASFGTETAHPLSIQTNQVERMRIDSSTGNIGVATTSSATYKLDVNGRLRTTQNLDIYQTPTTSGYYMSQSWEGLQMGGATFSIKTYDQNNLQTSVFLGAGKVGIGLGASNVSATLGVQGSISATSLALTGTGQSLSLTFPGWISVTFTNSWTNFDTASFNAAGYTIDAYGRVTLRGLIRSGTINSPAFTLQAGYRPPKMVMFPCATSSNNTSVLGELRIGTDGAVTVVSGGNGYVSLEGMNFNINA
jgi:hypothetical protein